MKRSKILWEEYHLEEYLENCAREESLAQDFPPQEEVKSINDAIDSQEKEEEKDD